MTILLEDFGSFYVGGRQVEVRNQPQKTVSLSNHISYAHNPNGSMVIEQAYIQYFVPAVLRFKTPVLLIHGGGLTGVTWETTPDGRLGWLHYLLEAGIAVYIIDNVERGRASWCPLPGIWPGVPLLRSEQEAWMIYKLGDPASRTPFPDLRFPLSHLDALMCQNVPRWTTTTSAALAALEAAIKRIGPCILIGHSQGGGLALRAALRQPELVTAVVTLEPHGFPDFSSQMGKKELAVLENMALLFVLADFNNQTALYTHLAREIRNAVQALSEREVAVELLDLPAVGMKGNSHMMMMDNNSDEIVSLIIAWFDQLSQAHRLQRSSCVQ